MESAQQKPTGLEPKCAGRECGSEDGDMCWVQYLGNHNLLVVLTWLT